MSNNETRPKNAAPQKGIRPHTPADGQVKTKKKKRQRRRGPVTKVVIATLQFGIIFYAALVATLLLLETRLVYPGAYESDAPRPLMADAGIVTVEYKSTDRLTLQGRLLERPDTDRILLVFHGNQQKATWLDGWLLQLAEEFNATTLMAEYRGYADDATPNEKGVIADCLAARNYLCDRYDKEPEDIILFGRSLGGGCAVAVASQGGAAGLVLDRTFDCIAHLAADKYPFVPVRYLMRNRFDSLARITVYDGPVVSLHGENDGVVPIENGRRLFDRAKGPKKWIQRESFTHFDAITPELYREIVTELDALMNEAVEASE